MKMGSAPMKYIIILSDGVSDRPIERLGGRTPLMVAAKPNIDALCARSRCGRLVTVPDDMPPGSEIANMAVLGYDVRSVYQGRGVLEAASIGIAVGDDDLVMRCNLICIEEGKIKNHSAGHITTEESRQLIEALNASLSTRFIRFHPGVSYRHVLIITHGQNTARCTPPHDVPGTPFRDVLVRPIGEDRTTAEMLNSLILMSQEVLRDHPVNQKRRLQGKDPANSIWPWSPGNRPAMKTLQELYGIKGAVISAVDLLYGIGAYAGMTPIKVDGSTGLYDTNYEGKARAAVDALRDHDLVYLHIEASDEAGHEGNVDLKIRTIEYLDQRVVRSIVERTASMEHPVAIALLPDHPTPCELRTHVHDPVPFMIHHPGAEPDGIPTYDEQSVLAGSYGLLVGNQFIHALLHRG
jgi:2,3-bisphosphoglycerate-independent phosphoglycerate mutase